MELAGLDLTGLLLAGLLLGGLVVVPALAVVESGDEVGELGGDGGVIVVAPNGEAVFSMNTSGMYRGRATSGGTNEVAIYADE